MKYYKRSLTHVVELDPMEPRVSVQNVPANLILHKNFVTSGYQMMQKIGGAYPQGIFVSEGKIIHNKQPHRVAAGTLIVYKNGKVDCKPLLDINQEKDVWFAVSGCSILPRIRMKEEGFRKYANYYGLGERDFSDIGRTTDRPVIGYNPTKNKIVIAVRPSSNIGRGQQTLKNLGCTMGITLDGGGSTVLRVNEKWLFKTTRQLYSVISWE
jgi:hypothetical protein